MNDTASKLPPRVRLRRADLPAIGLEADRLVDEAAVLPVVLYQARTILGKLDARDRVRALRELATWTRSEIGYTREARETFQRPDVTLRVRSGDCDDHAILICGLARSIRIPAVLLWWFKPRAAWPFHASTALRSASGRLVYFDTVEDSRLLASRARRGDLVAVPSPL